MDLSLYFTEHHYQVRDLVREFAQGQVAAVARELDRTSSFPWENVKTMGELGLLGVPWSEELGGAGMDQISYYITIHELAKVDASHGLTVSAHTNVRSARPRTLETIRRVGSFEGVCTDGMVRTAE